MSQTVYVDPNPGQVNFTGLLLGSAQTLSWGFGTDAAPEAPHSGEIVLWPGTTRQQRLPLTIAGRYASWAVDAVPWGTWAPYVLLLRATAGGPLLERVAGEIGARGRVT